MDKPTVARPKSSLNEPKPGDHEIDVRQHQRRCTICSHPEREAIEEDFLHWRTPWILLKQYGIASRSTLYRHAHALGLYDERRRNLRRALEYVIQEAERTEPSATEVIHAVRAYCCLQDSGEWREPVTTHRVIAGAAGDPRAAGPALAAPGAPAGMALADKGPGKALSEENSLGDEPCRAGQPAVTLECDARPCDDSGLLETLPPPPEAAILIGTQTQTGNAAND